MTFMFKDLCGLIFQLVFMNDGFCFLAFRQSVCDLSIHRCPVVSLLDFRIIDNFVLIEMVFNSPFSNSNV